MKHIKLLVVLFSLILAACSPKNVEAWKNDPAQATAIKNSVVQDVGLKNVACLMDQGQNIATNDSVACYQQQMFQYQLDCISDIENGNTYADSKNCIDYDRYMNDLDQFRKDHPQPIIPPSNNNTNQ